METIDRCSEPAETLTLDEALDRMHGALAFIEDAESVGLEDAQGRVLAEDIHAPSDMPPFPASAMDGYALRYEDIDDPGSSRLLVIGASFAGAPFRGEIKTGQCIRIFTGAAIPVGANAVVMQEETIGEAEFIRVAQRISPFSNIRPAGDEIRLGGLLLERGTRLGAAELGLLASAGMPKVKVNRKLRAGFFTTGNELRPVEEQLEYGQIHDSNRYLVSSLLANPALDAINFGIVRDDPSDVRNALLEASRSADVIITTGGVSVGEADFVTRCLAEVGRVNFWKLAIKPGKPFAFGRIGSAWFFGLPGNPVAVMVTFLKLVRPALMQLIGAKPKPTLQLKALCESTLKKLPGRVEFQRGVFRPDGAGGLIVRCCKGQGSHQLLGMSQANCFIVLPEGLSGIKPGNTVTIEPFADAFF